VGVGMCVVEGLGFEGLWFGFWALRVEVWGLGVWRLGFVVWGLCWLFGCWICVCGLNICYG
jgi:hypothetical protein